MANLTMKELSQAFKEGIEKVVPVGIASDSPIMAVRVILTNGKTIQIESREGEPVEPNTIRPLGILRARFV
jgi:hypothetical protein